MTQPSARQEGFSNMDRTGATSGNQSSSGQEEADGQAPRLRGFAAMSAEDRKRLGSKGGRTAHERGTANKFTPESASVAGRRPHENGTAHKWTSEEARDAKIGRAHV